MSKFDITVGSDPEFVIYKEGHPASAIEVTEATKQKPADLGGGVVCYADNALLEARFDPVSADGIVFKVGDMLRRLHSYVKSLDPGLALVSRAAVKYAPERLKHELNWVAGCNANYDAYRECPNKATTFEDTTRTGSFHIHIGNKNFKNAKETDPLMSLKSKIEAIKMLDLYLGLPSVLFDRDDTSILRRTLYGKAGEFRPTEYGIEYRVLGPYVANSPRLIRLAFDLVEHTMHLIGEGEAEKCLKLLPQPKVIEAINTVNKKMAETMVEKLNLPISLRNEITYSHPNEYGKGLESWV